MGINSTVALSRRGYLSEDELEQFADITVTDAAEAIDRISQAEELVDAYVGFQEQFMTEVVSGRCALAGTTNTLYLDTKQQNVYQNDFFKLCEVEILGGTGAGQRRKVSASDYETGKLTVDTNWTTPPDATSFFRVYQLGKFPR